MEKNRKKFQFDIVLIWVIFVITILPIIYVGLHNYPTGDDYWYGVYTYQGIHNGSLWQAFTGSLRMVKEFWYSWQGTWFTIFLFTLSPQNFNEHAYVLTVFISIGFMAWAFYILLHEYLVKIYSFSYKSFMFIYMILLIVCIQYMPRTTSGIYWFNGVMHYTIPLFLAFLSLVLAERWIRSNTTKDKVKYMTGVSLCLTALGGSSYLAAIIGLFGVFYILVKKILFIPTHEAHKIRIKIEKSDFFILIPFILELIGLYVSYKSPGNSIRSGVEMDIDLKFMYECVLSAIGRGIREGKEYLRDFPFNMALLGVISVITWVELWNGRVKRTNKILAPVLTYIILNGINWATYVPEIYSRSDFSMGVNNTHCNTFWMLSLASVMLVQTIILNVIELIFKRKKTNFDRKIILWKPLPAIAGWVGMAIVVWATFFAPYQTTNDYCINYVKSGRMEQYEKIWWQQQEVLSDDNVKDAVVPEYYDDIYPLCHMCMNDDTEMVHNKNKVNYFNKNTIVAYDYSERP